LKITQQKPTQKMKTIILAISLTLSVLLSAAEEPAKENKAQLQQIEGERRTANIDNLTLHALISLSNAARIVSQRNPGITAEQAGEARAELHAARAFFEAAIKYAESK
jgi:hypothetical protein